ncbi:MAG: GTPase ObgE [Rickettsiales bacterium]|nr:GTPase ObgE [Rickettsiales bacterium]
MKFIDEVRVTAISGKGGDGCSAFRREKFVPKGGPAGGNGGRGGHIIFRASRHFNTLHGLRFTPIIKAAAGRSGGPSMRTGAQGQDRVVEVPVGTLIRRSGKTRVLADLSEEGMDFVALEGGRGGRGNASFKSSTQRAPTQFELGGAAVEADFDLELKLLADVGLLGFPNAGKSTLISVLSAARPKVASYPFTTIAPSLGVVQIAEDYSTFVMADIPGLIEGAAEGAGLGHRFLRHVERCRILLHLISLDPFEDEGHGTVEERFQKMNSELQRYSPALGARQQIVLLSKLDLVEADEVERVSIWFRQQGLAVLSGSAVTGAGMKELVSELAKAIAAVTSGAD